VCELEHDARGWGWGGGAGGRVQLQQCLKREYLGRHHFRDVNLTMILL
jgi:hypothetical protein